MITIIGETKHTTIREATLSDGSKVCALELRADIEHDTRSVVFDCLSMPHALALRDGLEALIAEHTV